MNFANKTFKEVIAQDSEAQRSRMNVGTFKVEAENPLSEEPRRMVTMYPRPL